MINPARTIWPVFQVAEPYARARTGECYHRLARRGNLPGLVSCPSRW